MIEGAETSCALRSIQATPSCQFGVLRAVCECFECLVSGGLDCACVPVDLQAKDEGMAPIRCGKRLNWEVRRLVLNA